MVKLVAQLNDNLNAPILIVQHLSPVSSGKVLLDALSRENSLVCGFAVNGAKLINGHIYLAPPDHHLMIDDDQHILVTKGAHENRSRPAIDPLFRSAAVIFGSRAIGIVLTGYLDDGTAGMIALRRCGGICIVQDPKDAEYPDMPANVLSQVDVDYCMPISAMGKLIGQLLDAKPAKQQKVPKDITIEARIAKRVLSDLEAVNALGEQAPFNCPGCGGVLWKMGKGPLIRFRCFTGHAYTAAALLAEQTLKIEETMWVALRMFEERKNLLKTMVKDRNGNVSQSALERSNSFEVHIERIKSILVANDPGRNEGE